MMGSQQRKCCWSPQLQTYDPKWAACGQRLYSMLGGRLLLIHTEGKGKLLHEFISQKSNHGQRYATSQCYWSQNKMDCGPYEEMMMVILDRERCCSDQATFSRWWWSFRTKLSWKRHTTHHSEGFHPEPATFGWTRMITWCNVGFAPPTPNLPHPLPSSSTTCLSESIAAHTKSRRPSCLLKPIVSIYVLCLSSTQFLYDATRSLRCPQLTPTVSRYRLLWFQRNADCVSSQSTEHHHAAHCTQILLLLSI